MNRNKKNFILAIPVELVSYRVGKNGLGGFKTGNIVKAYRILSEKDSDIEILFYPEDKKNEVCACVFTCIYNEEDDLYEELSANSQETYINLKREFKWKEN